jgi:hypothetical protein
VPSSPVTPLSPRAQCRTRVVVCCYSSTADPPAGLPAGDIPTACDLCLAVARRRCTCLFRILQLMPPWLATHLSGTSQGRSATGKSLTGQPDLRLALARHSANQVDYESHHAVDVACATSDRYSFLFLIATAVTPQQGCPAFTPTQQTNRALMLPGPTQCLACHDLARAHATMLHCAASKAQPPKTGNACSLSTIVPAICPCHC